MKISTALQGVSILFVDTAPVIYLVEKNPTYLDRVETVFARVDSGQIRAMTNPITLSECLVHPFKNGLPALRQDFIDVIISGANTTFVEIDQRVGEEAARIRAHYNLRLPDSLQLSTALTNGWTLSSPTTCNSSASPN